MDTLSAEIRTDQHDWFYISLYFFFSYMFLFSSDYLWVCRDWCENLNCNDDTSTGDNANDGKLNDNVNNDTNTPAV